MSRAVVPIVVRLNPTPLMQGSSKARRTRPTFPLPLAVAVAALLAAPSGVMAQTGTSVASTAPQPDGGLCPANAAAGDDAFAFFIDKLETPGQSISLASFPPAALAKLSILEKAEVDRRATDWPYLCRYASKNAEVLNGGKRPKVVFIGDSITDFWQYANPAFFSAMSLDRGISGQTTPQILVRFYPDVIALKPRVVHILAGVNDLAGNTGPASDDMILDNFRAMIDLAKANHIKVVLASLLPANIAPKQAGPPPGERLIGLNDKLRRLAAQERIIYLDYYPHLLGPGGAMPATLTNDGLHPNRTGYAVMRPLAEQAIARALR